MNQARSAASRLMTPLPDRAYDACLKNRRERQRTGFKMQQEYTPGFEQKKTTFRGGLSTL